jgi:hypothetical protein
MAVEKTDVRKTVSMAINPANVSLYLTCPDGPQRWVKNEHTVRTIKPEANVKSNLL